MWKKFVKLPLAYRNLPKEIESFQIEQVGSGWYIYATSENGEKITIGRFNNKTEAETSFEMLNSLAKNR
ncbi:MAG: hypothetical protein IJD80_05515 [Oscillospiraceae bacterium]|nr:hypothetical protein [Oscillospiraceae bacterium]